MNNDIPHHSPYLDHVSLQKIIACAREAESLGQLHEDQLQVIYRNKWFKMFVPKSYGGLGLTLPEILRIEESLSWADGSTAWVVTLCSGAGWFIGFTDPQVRNEMFLNDTLCVAGSGALTGIAEVTNAGYEITGYWRYASGALHATAFTMNCYLKKNNQQLYNSDGSPQIRSFILKRHEVQLHHTWNGMGMIATGSHSFEVKRLAVPVNRSFIIDRHHATINDPIYQYPFLQLAETTLAVNLSGMAMRFANLAEALVTANEKHGSSSHALSQEVIKSRMALNQLRQLFFYNIDASWEELVSSNQLTQHKLAEISNASYRLVQHAKSLVNALYPVCGLVAAQTDSEINRIWRNVHTAGQHALFNKKV